MSMVEREFQVKITEEDGMLWAEVVDLPGTFASGEDMDELLEAVVEAIRLVEPDAVETPKKRTFRPSPPMRKPRVQSGTLAVAL